jgi:hypothetical protein
MRIRAAGRISGVVHGMIVRQGGEIFGKADESFWQQFT